VLGDLQVGLAEGEGFPYLGCIEDFAIVLDVPYSEPPIEGWDSDPGGEAKDEMTVYAVGDCLGAG
jgi:hypothetical protein